MGYLKHDNGNKSTKRKQAKPQPPSEPVKVVVTGPDAPGSLQHDINHVAGLAGIEQSLDWIAQGLDKLTHEDHPVSLSLGQGEITNPVQITLKGNDYDDTMDRFVTALERIADSVARLAGLSRPRLESWHEQCEYEPRYKDTACDGGAPGPKQPSANKAR